MVEFGLAGLERKKTFYASSYAFRVQTGDKVVESGDILSNVLSFPSRQRGRY